MNNVSLSIFQKEQLVQTLHYFEGIKKWNRVLVLFEKNYKLHFYLDCLFAKNTHYWYKLILKLYSLTWAEVWRSGMKRLIQLPFKWNMLTINTTSRKKAMPISHEQNWQAGSWNQISMFGGWHLGVIALLDICSFYEFLAWNRFYKFSQHLILYSSFSFPQ